MSRADGSVQRRLMRMMLLTSAAAIALMCLGLGGYEYFTSREQMRDHVVTLARVIATNSTAALAFRDERDASDVLGALSSEPGVVAAALYDEEGAVFAVYLRDARGESIPASARPDGFRFEGGHLQGFQPVREHQDQRLGTLYILSDMRAVYGRFWLYALIAGTVMGVSLLFAYVLSRILQNRISGPIDSLASTARAVSERGDFSVRAPVVGDGEFTLLTGAFNRMLERIDLQNSTLTDNERRLQTQLERLNLLQRTTRAIGERQDLQSIFHVILRNLEDNFPIDFGCVCLYEPGLGTLTVEAIGTKSAARAQRLDIALQSQLPLDENGLSRCVRGVLLSEPNLSEVSSSFAQRMGQAGLLSLVAAPLVVESKVFGVLLAARARANAFSSGDCEFLQQLSEHVALASHQAQLHMALQQAYDNLQRSQDTLLQQERLRALGQMASGVAHDINNAISPISLYTESLLTREPNLSDRAREYLNTIQRAIADVAQTVARMREFYRQRDQEADLAPVDLNAMIQQALTLTRARWQDMPQERGIVIDVRTDMAGDLPHIMGTESDIRDALTNLIFNAVDAMPAGGSLMIRTRVRDIDPKESNAKPTVELEVEDTGSGMDEETQRRCIEPFFTTKGERGTGMGLSMVYGMAKRHGAQIHIQSEPNRGTTFRLSFAVAAIDLVQDSAADESYPSARQRLLVIDDDPLLREALFHILQAEGHDVTTVDGGQAGIDAFNAAHGTENAFDAVMTDLGMPYVDGRNVAAAVKKLSPRTPVVLLTGWGQRFSTEQSVPPHVDMVLSKPPKLNELRRALAELQRTQAASRDARREMGVEH